MKDAFVAYIGVMLSRQHVPHPAVAQLRVFSVYGFYLFSYRLIFKFVVAFCMSQPLVIGGFRNMSNVA